MAAPVKPDPVFVFGSNMMGIHGAGAARFARERRGAQPGKATGYAGNSYALPTCVRPVRNPRRDALPLHEIEAHVLTFLQFARAHPELQFQVTAIGCGYAGFKPWQIAPFFKNAPSNCILPDEFVKELT